MRVLFLSIFDPFAASPVFTGATTVTRGLLQHWCREWEASAGGACEIRLIAREVRSERENQLRRVSSVIQGFFTTRASKFVYQETRITLKVARAALADGPWDLIVLNGSDMMGLLKRTGFLDAPEDRPPIWLVAHNVEFEVFRQRVAMLPSWVRPLFSLDVQRLENEEMSAFRAVDRIVCLCREDADRLGELCGDLQTEIQVEPIRFEGRPYRERVPAKARAPAAPFRLGMLANFGWWPNREGLDWFCAQVWPYLGDDFELQLFGPQSDQLAKHLGPHVHGWGKLPDLDDVWGNVDVMICPSQHGGGIRIKSAEAVWNGIPLITNSLGMRGITYPKCAPVLVAETAEEWVRALNSLRAEARRS